MFLRGLEARSGHGCPAINRVGQSDASRRECSFASPGQNKRPRKNTDKTHAKHKNLTHGDTSPIGSRNGPRWGEETVLCSGGRGDHLPDLFSDPVLEQFLERDGDRKRPVFFADCAGGIDSILMRVAFKNTG